MTDTRNRLENYVVATNCHLRDTVQSMDLIVLLRNAWPPYRADFARELYSEGQITANQLKEFTTIPKTK